MDLLSEIEALVYLSGQSGITIKQLVKLTGAEIENVKWSIATLKQRYEDTQHGICILQNGDLIHMATKQAYHELASRYLKTSDELLSSSAIESLTIIAYKQPVTRVEVDAVRGVNSSVSIRHLLAQKLVKENGTRDEPGNPKLYITTDLFLNAFGLTSLSELPPLEEVEDPDKYIDMFNDKMKPLEDKRNE